MGGLSVDCGLKCQIELTSAHSPNRQSKEAGLGVGVGVGEPLLLAVTSLPFISVNGSDNINSTPDLLRLLIKSG